MRRIVITGPPPVQILDVTGPLEVFANAPGYEIVLGSPEGGDLLRTNRGVSLSGAVALHAIPEPIDTLVIAGGAGAESGSYDASFLEWIAEAAGRSRRRGTPLAGGLRAAHAGPRRSR